MQLFSWTHNFKDHLIECKYFCCNKNYQPKFEEKLKEWFFSTDKFPNHDDNKFILFMWRGMSPYEYIDGFDKFRETSLSQKEYFYINLDMEVITNADYAHAKRVSKDFEI